MFLLKLFEAMAIREMSPDTYKSAERELRKKQANIGAVHSSVLNVPGSKDVTSKLSAAYQKKGRSADRISAGISKRVAAGVEKHRPKISYDPNYKVPPKPGTAPSAARSGAQQQTAPASTKTTGTAGRMFGRAALGGAALYGGYKAGKFLHRKYKQWKNQL